MAEDQKVESVAHAKTGGQGGEWVEYDSPKPSGVPDCYAFWATPPPGRSERCAWWLRQIERGWRPNRYVRREGYDSSAHWYGVYLWEYLNEIAPALRNSPGQPTATQPARGDR